MSDTTFSRSIEACTENGARLLSDAQLLFELDRYSTALALAVLAQEEFAKAFLLQLVSDGSLPWLPEVQKSLARHQSKHLLGLVMTWLPPFNLDRIREQRKRDLDRHEMKMAWYARQSERRRNGDFTLDPTDPEPVDEEINFPTEVATALNIYRFEEIERLRYGSPWKDEDWAKGEARKLADGLLDRKKQSALYVDVTKTGQVGLHPGLITQEDASEAIQRAERLSDPTISYSAEYRKLAEVLPQVFANLATNKKDEEL